MSGREQVVTILVTGFERFDGIQGENQSFVVASLLPAYLAATATCPTPIKVVCHPYPIRVSYTEVSSLVPNLYEAYNESVDMVLHLGLTYNQQHYSLEESAARDGYDEYADVDGQKFGADDGQKRWPEGDSSLKTTLDFEAIYSGWRSNLLRTPEALSALDGVVIRRNDGRGTFICDFVYYAMMAEYSKRRRLAAQVMEARPVLCLHMPGKPSLLNIKQCKVVVVTLLRAMAESWAKNNKSQQDTDVS